MNAIVSELDTLVSQVTKSKSHRRIYPPKVRESCVKLASSLGVKEVSRQSGISPVAIYRWIKEAKRTKLSPEAKIAGSPILRPLVLQEVARPSQVVGTESLITIESKAGILVRMPANSQILSLILDRMLGDQQ